MKYINAYKLNNNSIISLISERKILKFDFKIYKHAQEGRHICLQRKVNRNGKICREYNVYDVFCNRLLFSIWYDSIYLYSWGLIHASKYNGPFKGVFIFGPDGKDLLSSLGVTFKLLAARESFWGGFRLVAEDGRMNYLTAEGKLLSNTWYNCVYVSRNCVRVVNEFDKWNLYDKKKRELVFKEWADFITIVDESDTITVTKNGEETTYELFALLK